MAYKSSNRSVGIIIFSIIAGIVLSIVLINYTNIGKTKLQPAEYSTDSVEVEENISTEVKTVSKSTQQTPTTITNDRTEDTTDDINDIEPVKQNQTQVSEENTIQNIEDI